MSGIASHASRASWLVALGALVLSCASPAEPKTPSPPPPAAPSTPPPPAPPSAEVLTAQALQAVADKGKQSARPLLEQALQAWERESAQPVEWFDVSQGTLSPSVLGKAILTLDPTGALLARSEGHRISVFDTTTWRRVRILEGHSGIIRSLVFGPKGERIWSSASDGTVRLWDIAQAKLVHTAKDNHEVDELLISPDNDRLVYRCGHYLCSWKTNEDAPQHRRLRAPAGCLWLRHWLHDDTVITGKDGEETCYLNVVQGVVEKTLPFITGALVFPKKGDRFLTALPTARTVRMEVWSASKGQRIRSLSTAGDDGRPAVAMAMPSLSPNGLHAVALTHLRELTRWDTVTGKVTRRLRLPADIGRADYLHDGRVLLSYASGGGLALSDHDVTEVRPALSIPRMSYHTMTLMPQGEGFIAGIGERIQVWDLRSGTPGYELHDEQDSLGRTWLLRLSPDGKRLAALHARGLRVWDLDAKRVMHRAKPQEGERITALAFDAEGRLITTRSSHPPQGKRLQDGAVSSVSPAGADTDDALRFFVGAHAAVQVSSNAERVAVAPPGRGVRVFDTSRKSMVRALSVEGTWSLSPDGAWLAYVGPSPNAKTQDDSLQIVRISDGKQWVVSEAPSPAGPLAWRADAALLAASIVRTDGGHDVVLIEPESRAITARTQLGKPPGTYYLTLMPDGAHLLARYRHGGMSFHRLRDGVTIGSLGFMDDGQTWLVWTDAGVFDMGGPKADRLIGCRAGLRVLPFPLCEVKFRKPGLLGEVLKK